MRRHFSQRYFSREQLDGRLRAGLIGHWIGGGGVTLLDQTGYGNHGLLTNIVASNPVWDGGRWPDSDSLLYADAGGGNGNFVQCANSPVGAVFTISALIHPLDAATTSTVMCQGNATGTQETFFLRTGSSTSCGFTTAVATFQTTPGIVPVVAVWQRVSLRYDGVNLSVWLDRIKQSETPATGTPEALPANGVVIGRLGDTAVQYFNGRITDVRIYNRALSDVEMELLGDPAFRPVVPMGRRRFRLAPALLLDQEGFRFRNDDGSEVTATWLAAQDTNVNRNKNVNTRLRMLVNAAGNPASKLYQLEYRVNGGVWKKVTNT